jgi:hypothetical protein
MPHAKPQRREEFGVYFITLCGLAALREKKLFLSKTFKTSVIKGFEPSQEFFLFFL